MFSASGLLLFSVSGPDAAVGPGSCHLARWHACRRVHRQAVPLPELQRPPSERSGVDLSQNSWNIWWWLISSPLLFLSPPGVDVALCGIERQRPGSLSSALGAQSHTPSFPALPRPSGVSRRIFVLLLHTCDTLKNSKTYPPPIMFTKAPTCVFIQLLLPTKLPASFFLVGHLSPSGIVTSGLLFFLTEYAVDRVPKLHQLCLNVVKDESPLVA